MRSKKLSIAIYLFTCFFTKNTWGGMPPAQKENFKEWEGIYQFTHDDQHSFKSGKPYVVDPYIWAYTKEFAERFRMPAEWISTDLKGALAVAWRMTTIGDVSCGFGGNPEACIKPLECQLDVYYDNKIALPWGRPEIIRDNMRWGLSSSRFLGLIHGDSRRRYVPAGVIDGGGVLYTTDIVPLGEGQIVSYDKEFQDGLALITFVGGSVCPDFSGDLEKKVRMAFWTYLNPNGDKIKVIHVIQFPENFIHRAKPAYDEKKEIKDEWKNRFIEKR